MLRLDILRGGRISPPPTSLERLRTVEMRLDDVERKVDRIQDFQSTAFKAMMMLAVTVVGQLVVILATRK